MPLGANVCYGSFICTVAANSLIMLYMFDVIAVRKVWCLNHLYSGSASKRIRDIFIIVTDYSISRIYRFLYVSAWRNVGNPSDKFFRCFFAIGNITLVSSQ